MKGDRLAIGDAAAAEDIQGAADGGIQPAPTNPVDKLHIGKIPDPAGIGCRNGDPGR